MNIPLDTLQWLEQNNLVLEIAPRPRQSLPMQYSALTNATTLPQIRDVQNTNERTTPIIEDDATQPPCETVRQTQRQAEDETSESDEETERPSRACTNRRKRYFEDTTMSCRLCLAHHSSKTIQPTEFSLIRRIIVKEKNKCARGTEARNMHKNAKRRLDKLSDGSDDPDICVGCYKKYVKGARYQIRDNKSK
jgi:hypothetical protein